MGSDVILIYNSIVLLLDDYGNILKCYSFLYQLLISFITEYLKENAEKLIIAQFMVRQVFNQRKKQKNLVKRRTSWSRLWQDNSLTALKAPNVRT